MTVRLFIAISLDGFIARENGDLDWLPGASGEPQDSSEDYGYAKFIAQVDAILMGRNTFEKVLDFGEWPYGDMPVIILSASLQAVPESVSGVVSIMSGSPNVVLDRLNKKGLNSLYLDGGKCIQQFLSAGLVDELIITQVPVLLGKGIRLFGALDKDIQLELKSSKSYSSGMVQGHYEIIK